MTLRARGQDEPIAIRDHAEFDFGVGGVAECLGNIARFEVRVFSEDCLDGHSIRNHRHDSRDGNSETTNARPATHECRINADSLESHGALLRAPEYDETPLLESGLSSASR